MGGGVGEVYTPYKKSRKIDISVEQRASNWWQTKRPLVLTHMRFNLHKRIKPAKNSPRYEKPKLIQESAWNVTFIIAFT